jgi:hypothetical protein
MIDILLTRKGGIWQPWSEYDRMEGYKYQEGKVVRFRGTGVGAEKMRSYRELCAYKGSVDYISSQAFEDDNLNHPIKVDELTKCKFGFLRGDPIVRPDGGIQFPTDSLKYENCHQDRSHRFITQALEFHAGLVGIEPNFKTGQSSVDRYLQLLRDLK